MKERPWIFAAAELSALELSDESIAGFTQTMSAIEEAIGAMDGFQPDTPKPVCRKILRLREDIPAPGLPRERFVSSIPEQSRYLILVPKIIGK